ncbi:hypothetical protein [Paenibacillus sp. FSL H3-0333]|uniref:hypothetical protein n=2 Tax=unclassified Paenibacillus TaxID=185978 RepID=UPI0030F56DEB
MKKRYSARPRIEVKIKQLDIISARKMSKTKQIVGYEITVKLVMSKLESALRYRLLADFKEGKTMFLDRITGSPEDLQTDNVE